MTRQRILVVDDSCDLSRLHRSELVGYSDLLLLCWVAPDTLERLHFEDGPRCHSLQDVVGSQRRWELEAVALMGKVGSGGPCHRGRPWRALLSESLLTEARTVQAVLDAVRLCRELGDEAEVHLRVRGEVERIFRAAAGGGSPAPSVARAGRAGRRRPGLAARTARRIRHARVAGGWLTLFRNLLGETDRDYRFRLAAGRLLRGPRIVPEEVTFFSSYLNNSRTLATLEPYVAKPVTWVVANHPARQGAGVGRRSVHALWRFAPEAIPAALEDARNPVTDEPGEALGIWLEDSPTWRYWRETGRAALPRLTACWERYLDVARPRLVVFANHLGLEGWLAQLARDRSIPVLQLLHGVLGGPFFTETPLETDALIVWGDFWRDQQLASERRRIHVFNPGITATSDLPRTPSARPRLTYFSWPFDRLAFYNGYELLDGLIALFHELLDAGDCEVTIRAHPLENLDDLTRRWRELHGALPPGLSFSQREPLAEIVSRTDVAIMFRSTVMLDCFARGIPIVLPGWIDFAWNRSLEGVSGVHLAADFEDLRRTVREWLPRPPQVDREAVRPFLRPAGEGREDLDELLRKLTQEPPSGHLASVRQEGVHQLPCHADRP